MTQEPRKAREFLVTKNPGMKVNGNSVGLALEIFGSAEILNQDGTVLAREVLPPDPDRKKEIEALVWDWLKFWRNEADYNRRAMGVDANMRVDLQKRIAEWADATRSPGLFTLDEVQPLLDALKLVRQRFHWMGVDSNKFPDTEAGDVARGSIIDIDKCLANFQRIIAERTKG